LFNILQAPAACDTMEPELAMTIIELPDEQAAALRMKASREGLTLEAWLQELAEKEASSNKPLRTAADIVLSCMSRHGLPKKEA
jgi:plasmid stability protein